MPVFGEKLRDARAGLVNRIKDLVGGACLGIRMSWQHAEVARQQQQRQRGRAGLAEIAVKQQGHARVMTWRGEGEELGEGIELKKRDGRIDEVEPEIVFVDARQVAGVFFGK